MRRTVVSWILALAMVAFFSWPSATSAHGDEDHGDQRRPAGGCATPG